MDSPTRYAGVDWASRAHAICIVDAQGTALERFEVEHTGPGLRTLGRRLVRAGVGRVAIERPDGPVIDALFAAGLEVVVDRVPYDPARHRALQQVVLAQAA